MRIVLKCILGFVLGCIAGAVLGFAIGAGLILVFESTENCRFEGGCGMAAAALGMAGFWLGGIGGAIWLAVREARRLRAAKAAASKV